MKLRALHCDSKEIGLGQAMRLVANMGGKILESKSPELLIMFDPKMGEYWSLEDDRVPIYLLKEIARLAGGIINMEEMATMDPGAYPDLYKGKVNENTRKQAVVFVCREAGDYSQRVPSVDSRNFWRKLEEAFPAR